MSECIVVSLTRQDGGQGLASIPYTYNGRTVVYGEPSVERMQPLDPNVATEGSYPRAYARGWELRAERPPEVGAMDMIALAEFVGVEAGMMPTIARPPRNEPCPCGSGVKSKRCCWA